jgi:hypothetical protein
VEWFLRRGARSGGGDRLCTLDHPSRHPGVFWEAIRGGVVQGGGYGRQ